MRQGEHITEGRWELKRDLQVTRYDLDVDHVIAGNFVRSLSRLLRESSAVNPIQAEDDANFVEALRHGKIEPHQVVGRELSIKLEHSSTNAFGTFRLYNEAAIADTRQVLAEVGFGAISPDKTEQVSVLYAINVSESNPKVYMDKLIQIAEHSKYADELLKFCEAFEYSDINNPDEDLATIMKTVDRIRQVRAFNLDV